MSATQYNIDKYILSILNVNLGDLGYTAKKNPNLVQVPQRLVY